MIRQLKGERPAFILDTERTTYAFRILPTGQPEHLYYGRHIDVASAEELDALTEKHAFAPGNTVIYDQEQPEYSLEDMCLEFSSLGKGDIREPFLELQYADGGRTADFTYESCFISREKPQLEGLPSAYSEDGKAEHLMVCFKDKQYGAALELHYTVLGECICRSAVLINESAESIKVSRLLSMMMDLPKADEPYAVTSFHGAWTREMQKRTTLLSAGKLVIESRAGCTSSRANPFIMVHDKSTTEKHGGCYAFNLVYSGNHYACAEVSPFGKLRVANGINPQGFGWRLAPGERFTSPEAVMSFSEGGFTGISENMHFFVREHVVRGRWKNKPRPVLLNSWEACYFKISESGLYNLAKAGQKLGIELFVVDDGWFGERNDDSHSLGDWYVNEKKLPHGIMGLADKVTALGMDFGIWVEPEMVNTQSKLYEKHPEWAMAIPGKPHSEGRNQRVLDLANPAVQDYIIESMSRLFSSARISYVKWDFNRIFSDVFSPYLPADRQGETAHRYALGLYRVLDKLTKRFPDILFEGCASGGNRFDLGILSYFPQIWASDNTDALSRAYIQEGYSYGYPQSVIGAHISSCPNHQTLRDTPLDTRFNVAAFGLLGYEYDLRDLNGEKSQKLREQIETYKKWRDVLQFGRFYRGRSGNIHEWTCVSQDGRRAVGMILNELTEPNDPNERFFPRGLDPELRYRFYNAERKINIKRFGSLINTSTPFRVKQDSIVHNVIDRIVKMPGETEEYTASGSVLMGGVKLKQAFTATGYSEQVRFFADYFSRLYFMEEAD